MDRSVFQGVAGLALGLLLFVLFSCDGGPISEGDAHHVSTEQIVEIMQSVRDHQLAKVPHDRKLRRWRHCTFYAGMMAAYRATGNRVYVDSTHAWAQRNEWMLGSSPSHPDHQCVGQVYLELYETPRDNPRITPTRSAMEGMVGDSPPGHELWDWADALFMAPPVLVRLGAATGEEAYFSFVSERFWEASGPLFDPEYGLYYRDERFNDRLTTHGAPVFWSRGNGWVLAGVVRVLQYLPEEHRAHSRFVGRLQTMAEAVASVQQDDGLWRTSLLDPRAYPMPETSGTALFTYALAWGVNHGYLPDEKYRPVVLNGWNGLVASVNEEGRLGWVQDVGSRPGPVSEEDTGAYGVGAFLMAGSEVLSLIAESSP